jgi:hypothetical protein
MLTFLFWDMGGEGKKDTPEQQAEEFTNQLRKVLALPEVKEVIRALQTQADVLAS